MSMRIHIRVLIIITIEKEVEKFVDLKCWFFETSLREEREMGARTNFWFLTAILFLGRLFNFYFYNFPNFQK